MPVAVTVKVPADPTVKVVPLAERDRRRAERCHREDEGLGGAGCRPRWSAVMVIG